MKKLIALSLVLCSTLTFADVNVSVQATKNGDEQEVAACVKDEATGLWHAVVAGLLVVSDVVSKEGNEVELRMKVFAQDENNDIVVIAEPVITTEWGNAAVLNFVNSDPEQEQKIEIKVVAAR